MKYAETKEIKLINKIVKFFHLGKLNTLGQNKDTKKAFKYVY